MRDNIYFKWFLASLTQDQRDDYQQRSLNQQKDWYISYLESMYSPKVDIKQDRYIKSGSVVLDRNRHTVQINGAEPMVLEKLLFNLLAYLISNENKVVERTKLLSEVWGTDVVVCTRTVDVAICKIRRIIGNRIQTIKKVGYIFES